ncbi:aldehyde dehydrogenase (NAD+) [Alicyclobacillus sacchari]|uniref:Aldehyde dehydrogenase (NAD+) n=1 Tax=Alicyclobacillus sacchari TaxID=392010 RepID=A0A4R8LIX3_9BACL|nr:aldehyde dehydrogenase family protein [Alicyclobacillus sacchari]TDY42179.1 aldehyde dehydrogenase (NAD+) [Alicyclobacillus sacchari]
MESKNWIGGEWYAPTSETMVISSPSDISVDVGVLHFSDESDVIAAGDAARKALPSWADQSPMARGDILYRAAALLEQQLEEIAVLASSEMGKPITEMKGEVMRGVNLLKYYAAEGARAVGQVIPASQSQVLQYTSRVPLGVVAIITPWNFPVAIPIWKIAPALICGNTVIWKPAENASLSATRIAQVFADAGVPAGVLNVVIGRGPELGGALFEKTTLDGVGFTGSTNTGMHVAAMAAARNIKYQTEMGGKNAAVVLADADLSVAVPAILSGAFRSAGQKCTATSRVIVEATIYDAFLTALTDQLKDVYTGFALDPRSYLGPVASRQQFEKVQSYVKLAETNAKRVHRDHLNAEAEGYYVQPLVIEGVDRDSPLVTDEIFGPVMALLPASGFDEAVQLSNQTVYGLSASVFTQNIHHALRFLNESEAGMVRVNLEFAGVEYQAPFGGMKASSSHSREQGQAALDFYTQTKTCAIYYG